MLNWNLLEGERERNPVNCAKKFTKLDFRLVLTCWYAIAESESGRMVDHISLKSNNFVPALFNWSGQGLSAVAISVLGGPFAVSFWPVRLFLPKDSYIFSFWEICISLLFVGLSKILYREFRISVQLLHKSPQFSLNSVFFIDFDFRVKRVKWLDAQRNDLLFHFAFTKALDLSRSPDTHPGSQLA